MNLDCISSEKSVRRLSILQRAGLFVKDSSCSRYTRATTAADILQAFSLVHDVYVEKKYLLQNKFRIRIRPFDIMPHTATFVAKHPVYSVVGAFSVIPDSPELGLPSERSFRDELDALRGPKSSICELSNQAIHRAFRKSAISTELMRCAYAHAYHIGCTDLICAISPGLVSFYEFMEFEPVSGIKSSSPNKDDPVVIMRLPRVNTRWTSDPPRPQPMHTFWRDFFETGNAYRSCVAAWSSLAEQMYANESELVTLCNHCAELLQMIPPVMRYSLSSQLGIPFSRALDSVAKPPKQQMKWCSKGSMSRLGYSLHPSVFSSPNYRAVSMIPKKATRNSKPPRPIVSLTSTHSRGVRNLISKPPSTPSKPSSIKV